MSTRYAPFSSQDYNCLDPGLEGIGEAIALVFAEERIAKIDKELQSLLRAVPSREQAMQRIERDIAAIASESVDAQDRKATLESLVDSVRCQIQEEWSIRPIAAGRIREICGYIRGLYSPFDADAFTEDMKQVIAADCGNTTEDQIKQLKQEKSNINGQIKKSWNARRMVKFFRFVPDVWRDRKVTESFRSGDMAIHILRSLISDWRERCRYYTMPVTVGGVAITTLEPSIAEIWMGFYERLNLKPGDSNRFRFRDAEHRGSARRPSAIDGLPGFFGSADAESQGNGKQVTEDELSRI